MSSIWYRSGELRASRLLSVLMLLQSRGRVSAAALSRELGVSVRTILRDLEHLGEAGIPVTSERGRGGGFELLRGWRTRLTGLTPDEARALFLAGLPGPASELGLGEALASAELKLLATLPDGWSLDARRVRERLHLDPFPWYRSAARSRHLVDVSGAVWNDRRLRMRYQSWKGVVERTIDPLGLVLKAGEWYLVGRSGSEPRTYRLSSVVELTVEDARFVRPPAFDLAACWAESTARFEKEINRGSAVLRVTAAGVKKLRAWNAAVAAAVDGAAAVPAGRGRLRVTIPIESIENAASELLRLGADVEALEPAELRRRVAEGAAAVLRIHRGPRPQRGRLIRKRVGRRPS